MRNFKRRKFKQSSVEARKRRGGDEKYRMCPLCSGTGFAADGSWCACCVAIGRVRYEYAEQLLGEECALSGSNSDANSDITQPGHDHSSQE